MCPRLFQIGPFTIYGYGLMLVLGYWGMPWFLRKVADLRSREVFLLTVIVICLAAAFGTFYFGLCADRGIQTTET